jgi:hypothetical protein
VSTTEKLPPPVDQPTDQPAGEHSGARPRTGTVRAGSRRGRRIAVAATLTVLAAGGVGVAVRATGPAGPLPATAPITLPAQLQGLSPLPASADPTAVARWQERARTAAGAATLAARSYGPADGSRMVRAVAARTDLTDKLEQAWAADAGHAVGKDHCTQNVQLVPSGRAGVRPTMIVCWRTGASLSAYAVVIAPKSVVTDADGAAALDELWNAVTRG